MCNVAKQEAWPTWRLSERGDGEKMGLLRHNSAVTVALGHLSLKIQTGEIITRLFHRRWTSLSLSQGSCASARAT